MTALGAMRSSSQGLAAEMCWSPRRLAKALREGLREGLMEHNEKACFLAVPNFLKYNSPESPNVVKAWKSSLDLIPECDLKVALLHRVKVFAEGLPEGFTKALPEAFAKSMPYPEPEPEPEQEHSPSSPSSPSLKKDSTKTSKTASAARAREAPDPAKGCDRISNHWNSHDALTQHKSLTPKMRSSIRARLKADYTATDLCRAITRYAELCQEERAPGHNQWGLHQLISRDQGVWIDRMLDPKYRGIQNIRPPPGHTKRSQQNVKNAEDWVNRRKQNERK